MAGLPLLLTIAMLAVAALAPLLARWQGRDAGFSVAVAYAAGTAALLAAIPEIAAGRELAASLPWVPGLGIRLAFRLDGLSLLFGLLILGVGALVMAYSARYLKRDERHGRFYGLLTLFAASMLGLVLADDMLLLFVFWELTSITSFFLIGGRGGAEAGRSATRAFLVTGLGGLALFAGLVLAGIAAGGFGLHEAIANPGLVREHAFAPAIMILLFAGAFTKSAQVPFHFWLPGAMVAPTPVSTYLHAATMVKAGIYLLARFSGIFGGDPAWTTTIVLVGLVTAVVGAVLALKQHDLKSLLAYSTVSQLGLLMALVGVGTYPAMAAAALHVLAHGMYKASLFMVVGIIEHEAGSRDIRRLSGLRRMMPRTAAVTGVAALSMAGLPPLLGFVSKEESFAAFLGVPGAAWLGATATVLAVSAAVMTFAYGARIFDGAFGGDAATQRLYDPPRTFLLPAALPALVGLLGLLAWTLDPLVGRAAGDALGTAGETHLALWHGLTPALGLSALTIAAGSLLFVARRPAGRVLERLRSPVRGGHAFDVAHDGIVASGRWAGRPFLTQAPRAHLPWVLATALGAAFAAWHLLGGSADGPPPRFLAADRWLAGALALAVVALAWARNRLAAVAILGTVGFLVAVLYVLLGAPDLALTQLLVETLTVALVVLVFRGLPKAFPRSGRRRIGIAAGVAVVTGLFATAGTYLLTGRRDISTAGDYFLGAAVPEAGGKNVVNTILVDFRAFDTLGEITVLAVAAIGVFLLVRRTGDR